MRIVAANENEYRAAASLQKLMTARFKEEQQLDPQGPLTVALRMFINTPLEKEWEKPGTAIAAANNATRDTEDIALIVPYLVQAAVARKKVAIEYFSDKKGISKRIIEPMNWNKAKSGGVNIVAWCHDAGAWRHFNPVNIRRVAILDEDFNRSEDVELTPEHAREIAAFMGNQ